MINTSQTYKTSNIDLKHLVWFWCYTSYYQSILPPRAEILDSNRTIKSASRLSFMISENISAFIVSHKTFCTLHCAQSLLEPWLATTWYMLHQMSMVHREALSSLNLEQCCLHTLIYQGFVWQTDLFRDRYLLTFKISVMLRECFVSI